jgi:Ca-activated chloride channel family protein
LQGQNDWQSHVDAHLFKFLTGTSASRKSGKFRSVLLASLLTLTVLALAGPAWQRLPQPLYTQTTARVVVVDLSYSMLAGDLKPSRMEKVRFKLFDLLKRLDEGETALLAYAGDAHVIAPLTTDSKTLAHLARVLHPELMPSLGSRADLALQLAVELLDNRGAKSGSILWITDGVDSEQAATIAKLLRLHRLRILAVGTTEGSPIPLAQGGFLKDADGAIVIPKLELENLRKTNPEQVVRMTVDDTDLDILLAESGFAAEFEERKGEQRVTDEWAEEGPWLLLAALPLGALFFRRGMWSLLIGICFFGSASSVRAWEWRDLWQTPDQQAQTLLEQSKFEQAAERFDDPERRGYASYQGEQYEAAAQEFASLKSARSHYNRGNALAKLGRYPEALGVYEKALKLDQDHEDAQFNRDLLRKLLEQQQPQQSSSEQQQQDSQQEQSQSEQQGQSADSQSGDSESSEQSAQQSSGASGGEEETSTSDSQQAQQADSETQDTLENSGRQKTRTAKAPENGDDAKQSMATPADSEQSMSPEQQLLEMALRKIPDDPGRLLRNKLLREQQRRGTRKKAVQQW